MKAVFASENLMAITGPCGHTVPIEQAMDGRDRYKCPVCNLRFHVHRDPPIIYPSGFIMPGKGRVVVDPKPAEGMA